MTAVAYPNIALIKYWGKRDEHQAIPWADSLSITLDVFPTTTTVCLDSAAEADRVTFGGTPARGAASRRVAAFLDLVRKHAGRSESAVVSTRNAGPTGAGLASSASGFAALARAAVAAYGLELDAADLSRLARRGSGSAARSIFGGFALWHAGEDDHSSYAERVDVEFDPAVVIALVDGAPKRISSRAAMRRTVETSPLYRSWIESSRADLAEMTEALARNDLAVVGEIAERNALGMHATMLAARPAVRYLTAPTLGVLDSVAVLRSENVPAYATMDAGPNVKVLCRPGDADQVALRMRETVPCCSTVIARRGPGVTLRIEEER
ncbi:diphosphomevalonate decarboxylase [Amycolatopsis azurea]|uniref:diphosphomevalonate decarboxylase n=1 Tax=Amycolatopsis azurea DSM 43854 TaxID=1238180 RepID=M2QAD5_9PSEU|nr:diphosphomevalonate decarboxylase [Amycolatopsis azurea]EMD23686.1 Diphosphomevalonate decarboxylase [Amycolatopsis azurea DSM 43854]